jgi:hypothetical protein
MVGRGAPEVAVNTKKGVTSKQALKTRPLTLSEANQSYEPLMILPNQL